MTFHANLGNETHRKLQKRGVDLMMHSSYEAQINWLFRSAERFYPRCRKVIITDQETEFHPVIHDHINGEIEIFRAHFPGSGAMLSRAQAQTEWLEKEVAKGGGQDSPIVMLDSDVLINRDLEPLCSLNYEIAMTYRGNDEMPINGGVFFIAPLQQEAALRFSRWVQFIYESHFSEDIWYGHQRALIETIGWENYKNRTKIGAVLTVPPAALQNADDNRSVQAQLWHVGEWNRTVSVKWLKIRKMSSARILHFKGPRKILMRPYFFGYLQSPQSLAGKTKKYGWRGTLYLFAGLQKSLKRLNDVRILVSSRREAS
ncbi:MAG TPA: hypothetical protein VF627_09005 [Abditibacterium sp.]